MQAPHRKKVRHYDQPGHVHELTFSCYRRLPLLTNDQWREQFCIAVDRATDRHHHHLLAFVLMPEHVHLMSILKRMLLLYRIYCVPSKDLFRTVLNNA